MFISVEIDKRRLLNPGRKLEKALAKATTSAARALRAAATKSVRQRKRFKVSKLRRALPLRRVNTQEWRMGVSGETMPVASFPYRQVKRGVSVAINQGQRKLIKSAFVATMKSGHRGVFRRVGKSRLPIEELFTTRVSDVFNDQGMLPAVLGRTQDVFRSTFERLMPGSLL